MNSSIDIYGFIGNVKFVSGEFGVLNIGDFDFVVVFFGVGRGNVGWYSKEWVGSDGYGEDGVERVVDVFVDDVYFVGWFSYEFGWLVVDGLEVSEEVVLFFCLSVDGINGVDVV